MIQPEQIASAPVQEYLQLHAQDDVHRFALAARAVGGLPPSVLADQLRGLQQIKSRWPSWSGVRGLVFPSVVSLEQSSSESTARYKATLVNGSRGLDLTCGWGVDSFFLSANAQLTCVEADPELLEITQHNHKCLGLIGNTYVAAHAEQFVLGPHSFDFIYVDPSRRKDKRRVTGLEDCSPDVTAIEERLLQMSTTVLIKASPMLDLEAATLALKNVTAIHVVSVKHEVREVLYLLTSKRAHNVAIRLVNLEIDGSVQNEMVFTREEEQNAAVTFGDPESYIYEPWPAWMKAGCFRLLSARYKMKKLGASSHLYTSAVAVEDFPGRRFRILREVKLDRSLSKDVGPLANIVVRNFPLSPAEIMKKTGLREGGEQYLICTTSGQRKMALLAAREK